MAGSTQIHTLHHALDLYADGQMAVDELVPFIEQYEFAPIIEGRGFPQTGTLQEVVDRWHTGQIPDEDYEQILDAVGPLSPLEAGVEVKAVRYNPDARDADLDRIVQEGTPWARPATPRIRTRGAATRRRGAERLLSPADIGGDCFEVAGKMVVEDPTGRLTLVHGLVMGQAGGTATAGKRHWHSWVERTDEIDGHEFTVVIDKSNGNDVELPAAFYYAVGSIRPDDTYRYDRAEAIDQMLEHEHYGPWVEDPPGGPYLSSGTDEPLDPRWSDRAKVERFARDAWEMTYPASDGSGTFTTRIRRIQFDAPVAVGAHKWTSKGSIDYPSDVADTVPPHGFKEQTEFAWNGNGAALDIMDSDSEMHPSGYPVRATGEVLFTPADGGPVRRVGYFDRYVDPVNKDVHHQFLELVPSAQRKGFATAFNRHGEDAYRDAGMETESLMADMNGSYVWALAGFQFAPSEFARSRTGEFHNEPYVYEVLDYYVNINPGYEFAEEQFAPEALEEAKALLKRAKGAGKRNITPREIALLGKDHILPGGRSLGEAAMTGNSWRGVRKIPKRSASAGADVPADPRVTLPKVSPVPRRAPYPGQEATEAEKVAWRAGQVEATKDEYRQLDEIAARRDAIMAAVAAPPFVPPTNKDPDLVNGEKYWNDDAAALAHPEIFSDLAWDQWLAWKPCREIRQAAARMVGVRGSALDPQRDLPPSSKGPQPRTINAPWMAAGFLRGIRDNGVMHDSIVRSGGRVTPEQAAALVASLPNGVLVDLPLISAADTAGAMAYYDIGSSARPRSSVVGGAVDTVPPKMYATHITIKNAKGLDGAVMSGQYRSNPDAVVEVLTGGRFRVVSATVREEPYTAYPFGGGATHAEFAGTVEIVMEQVGVFDPDSPPGTIIETKAAVGKDRWVGVLHPWLDRAFDGPLNLAAIA